MSERVWFTRLCGLVLGTVWLASQASAADDQAVLDAIHQAADANVAAFNAGKVDDIVSGFLPEGEWIDEHGNVYQGREAIADVLKTYFKEYPDARITLGIESIRLLGPVAIDEGVRVMSCGKSPEPAHIRYIAVRVKTDAGWQIASLRDFGDDLPITPHERLQPLAWLVGDWVNEGSDAHVKISYSWSEDRNFLMANFVVTEAGEPVLNTSQRVGWDPVTGKIRSWVFDSDGGYGSSLWTEINDGWLIKSEAVSPEGIVGSATVKLVQTGPDRFRLQGFDRIAGDMKEDDFELDVVRQPPASGK